MATRVISVRLSADEHAALRVQADADGVKVNTLARRLLAAGKTREIAEHIAIVDVRRGEQIEQLRGEVVALREQQEKVVAALKNVAGAIAQMQEKIGGRV